MSTNAVDKHEVCKVLAAERAAIEDEQRSVSEEAKTSANQEIRDLEESWLETEKRHHASLKELQSESWNRALLALYKERRGKYETARSKLAERLSNLADSPMSPPLDFDAINRHIDAIEKEISKYKGALSVKRRQLEFVGDYGSVENEKWRAEIARFLGKNPTTASSIDTLQGHCLDAGLDFDWSEYLARCVDEFVSPASHLSKPERRDGVGFENACLASLVNAGWEGILTKTSGDQGVDIIARKGDLSVAIQCKCHSIPVGNGAVQEVHSGKAFYEASIAVVVSESGFTASAIQLAQKLGVRLIDSSLLHTLDDLL